MTQIVVVNVSQQLAPKPSQLQKTGAFVSQGATDLAPGAMALLTSLSALTAILNTSEPLATISYGGGTVTATASSPHGFTLADPLWLTIAGVSVGGYNGTWLCTPTSPTAFTYAVPYSLNPASGGTYVVEDVAELLAMGTTFFAQGANQAVYVLELGPGSINTGVTELTTFITNTPNFFYSYLVPRTWDGNANFLALIADFDAPTSKTYFFVTTTLATWTLYTALMKDVIALIETPNVAQAARNVLTGTAIVAGDVVTATTTTAHGVLPGDYFTLAGNLPAAWNGTFLALPGTTGETLEFDTATAPGTTASTLGVLQASPYPSAGIPATEFTLASTFWDTLNYAPSSSNKVTPLAYTYEYGVTPYPTQGNGPLLTNLANADVNVIGTGSEGGISLAIQLYGTTKDGNDFTYWYSADWVQINLDLNLANAVINGSNNPVNPLYYNQDGINRLQTVAASTMSTAVTDGLALGTVTLTQLSAADFATALDNGTFAGQIAINAEPFLIYSAENPDDYGIGKYGGLSVVYVPARGFRQIVVQLVISNFVAV